MQAKGAPLMLKLDQISKKYHHHTALKDLSFTVERR